MERLAHEVYGTSSHYWYAVDLMAPHDYGQIFNSDTTTVSGLVEAVSNDIRMASGEASGYESMFWYFGKSVEDVVVMVRYLDHAFVVQVNVQDFDFALHYDQIAAWKAALMEGLLS